LKDKIEDYMDRLKIRETLRGFSHTIKFVEKISKEEKQKE
jgi:hypothetical protein